MTEKLLVFSLEKQSFAIYMSKVIRIVRAVKVTHVPHVSESIYGVINFHKQLIPVINLRYRFGFPHKDIIPDDRFIISMASGKTVALVVEDVIGVEDVSNLYQTEVAEFGAGVRMEGMMMRENDICFIYDLEKFLSEDEVRFIEEVIAVPNNNQE